MSRHLLLSTAALALVLAAHPAGAQTSTAPTGTTQQTQQAPAARAPAQQQTQPSAPSSQQNAQQPAPTTQQNAEQPAKRSQQNAQQPTGTQQKQQTTQQPSTGTQQNAQQPATGTQQKQQTTQQPSTGTQQQTTQQPATGTQTQQTTQGGATSSGASVSLNTQQRTQISQVIARSNVEPLRNVNFSISVGTVVPTSVRIHTLPADIVAIVPQYRGYSYVVVEEEIVIIEPRSHRIVAVLPYGGERKGAGKRSSTKVELSREDREKVRRHATESRKSERTTTTRKSRSYEVGEEVPDSVTIERFTETYEVPTVRRYRYFTEGSDVILVDPDEDRVIEIIR